MLATEEPYKPVIETMPNSYRQSPRKIKTTMSRFQGERRKFFPISNNNSRSTRNLLPNGEKGNRPLIRVQRNLDGTRYHYCPVMNATSDHIKNVIYPKDTIDFNRNNIVTNENYGVLCDNARKIRHERYATTIC